MKLMKKILSSLLYFVILIGILQVLAFADEAENGSVSNYTKQFGDEMSFVAFDQRTANIQGLRLDFGFAPRGTD